MVKTFKVNERVEGKTSKVKGLIGTIIRIVRNENQKDQYEVQWDNGTVTIVTSSAINLKRDREESFEETRAENEEILSPQTAESIPASISPSTPAKLTGADLEREENEERSAIK